MELTKTERLILLNQFRILKSLNPNEDNYDYALEVLEKGYEYHYKEIIQDSLLIEEFPFNSSQLVLDILYMFSSMRLAYNKLSDKSNIVESKIRFPGFCSSSGGFEAKCLSYARFYVNQQGGLFRELGNIENSDINRIPYYREMLAEFEKSQNKFDLTKEDIIRIISKI